jgi:antitoxin VapB
MNTQRSTQDTREAKLFRNNKCQAVRIPADFELICEKVKIYRDGARIIIEPIPKKSLVAVLTELEDLLEKDSFPDIDHGLLPLEDIDL